MRYLKSFKESFRYSESIPENISNIISDRLLSLSDLYNICVSINGNPRNHWDFGDSETEYNIVITNGWNPVVINDEMILDIQSLLSELDSELGIKLNFILGDYFEGETQLNQDGYPDDGFIYYDLESFKNFYNYESRLNDFRICLIK